MGGILYSPKGNNDPNSWSRFVWRVLMPRSAVGGLIGRQGESIKKLQEATGARISVENATYMQPSSEQVVTVSNTNKDLGWD